MTFFSSYTLDLQDFEKWWFESSPADSNFADIPSYHIGRFISNSQTYELWRSHEALVTMIPAHYRNGLRFLNHIIICLHNWCNILGLNVTQTNSTCCNSSMRLLVGNSCCSAKSERSSSRMSIPHIILIRIHGCHLSWILSWHTCTIVDLWTLVINPT
jgi:hypothetical protein